MNPDTQDIIIKLCVILLCLGRVYAFIKWLVRRASIKRWKREWRRPAEIIWAPDEDYCIDASDEMTQDEMNELCRDILEDMKDE